MHVARLEFQDFIDRGKPYTQLRPIDTSVLPELNPAPERPPRAVAELAMSN